MINSAYVFEDNQLEFLKRIKKKFNIASLESFLSDITNKKITLIGESIIDQYTELSVLNKSGKESILNYSKKMIINILVVYYQLQTMFLNLSID